MQVYTSIHVCPANCDNMTNHGMTLCAILALVPVAFMLLCIFNIQPLHQAKINHFQGQCLYIDLVGRVVAFRSPILVI